MSEIQSIAPREAGLTVRNGKGSKAVKTLISRIKEYRYSYLLMLPFSIVFMLFTVLPVGIAIYYSFTYYNVLQSPQFVGWANYLKLLFEDDIFLIAVKNTMIFAVITGPLSYFFCFIIAWLVNELPPRIRSLVTLLFYAPALAGSVSLTMWQYIFSSDNYGMLNSVLLSTGIVNSPVQWFVNPSTIKISIIVIVLWMSLSVSFLSFIAGFQNVNKTLYEAGAVDGIRNRYQEIWFITLPAMKGQLLFAAVMSITSSFGIGSIVTQLCGFPSSNYQAHTIINHLQDYGSIRFDMGYACAIATILFVIMVGTNKLVNQLISKVGE